MKNSEAKIILEDTKKDLLENVLDQSFPPERHQIILALDCAISALSAPDEILITEYFRMDDRIGFTFSFTTTQLARLGIDGIQRMRKAHFETFGEDFEEWEFVRAISTNFKEDKK